MALVGGSSKLNSKELAMSYNNFKNKATTIIELSHSTNQSVSAGSAILFNTLRASGSHGVSVDGSGNISLDTGAEYWIQASFDIERGTTSDSWAFDFYNASSGTVLSVSDGAFQAQWQSGNNAKTNATLTAAYVQTAPLSSIALKATTMTTTGTVTTNTRVIIIEVSA